MTVAGSLARTFVKAAKVKKAEEEVRPRMFEAGDVPGPFSTDDPSLRREFEDSLRHEEILRDKAQQYARLARSRGLDQQGAGGEFFKRLAPIPYSGGEAAWRLPAIAAGAFGGKHLGEKWTGKGRANPEEVAKALHSVPHGAQVWTALEEQLGHLANERGTPLAPRVPADPTAVELVHGMPVSDVADILGKRPLKGKTQAMAALIEAKGVPRELLQEAYARLPLGAGAKGEAAQRYLTGSGLGRWGGAVGGGLAAGALTGLPLAIRGAALRRTGGEMAHSARNRMRKAIEQAELEQFKRENVLRSIKGETPLPMSEWRQQKHQMRKDWRGSVGEYRDMAKSRRHGERKTGITAPVEKEAGLNLPDGSFDPLLHSFTHPIQAVRGILPRGSKIPPALESVGEGGRTWLRKMLKMLKSMRPLK
jgi:hypothetical protein